MIVDTDRKVIVGATVTGAEVADFIHPFTIAIVGRGPDGAPLARRPLLPDPERAMAAPAGVLPSPVASAPCSDDHALVERLRAGDEAAFAEVVDRYDRQLRRLARTFVRTDALADDVVQETWLARHPRASTASRSARP